jgi:hypothetical protein
MGIEPTGKVLPELENKRFPANADAKCDGRVNFRGMRGYVGIHGCAKARAQAFIRRSLNGNCGRWVTKKGSR